MKTILHILHFNGKKFTKIFLILSIFSIILCSFSLTPAEKTKERALFLYDKYPTATWVKSPVLKSQTPDFEPKFLYAQRFDRFVIPQNFAYGVDNILAPMLPDPLFDIAYRFSFLIRMMTAGPLGNPLHPPPAPYIDICNALFLMLSNGGMNITKEENPHYPFGFQEQAISSFDISKDCLDLPKMFNSQNLWFFCLYCPIRNYPNSLPYPSSAADLTQDYSDPQWLESAKVNANQLKTIEDTISKSLLRNVYKMAFDNLVDEVDPEGKLVEDAVLPHFVEFNYPRFPYMNRGILCYPTNWYSRLVGEKFIDCTDTKISCTCENRIGILGVYAILLTLAQCCICCSFPFLVCCGIFCGALPHCINICRRKTRFILYKCCGFVFWVLSGICIISSFVPIVYSTHYFHTVFYPFVVNVFGNEARKMPTFETEVFWATRSPTFYLFRSICYFLYCLGFEFSLISFVFSATHFFFLSKLFKKKTNRKIERIERILINLGILVLLILCAVNFIFIFLQQASKSIEKLLDATPYRSDDFYLALGKLTDFFGVFNYLTGVFLIRIPTAVVLSWMCWRAIGELWHMDKKIRKKMKSGQKSLVKEIKKVINPAQQRRNAIFLFICCIGFILDLVARVASPWMIVAGEKKIYLGIEELNIGMVFPIQTALLTLSEPSILIYFHCIHTVFRKILKFFAKKVRKVDDELKDNLLEKIDSI